VVGKISRGRKGGKAQWGTWRGESLKLPISIRVTHGVKVTRDRIEGWEISQGGLRGSNRSHS